MRKAVLLSCVVCGLLTASAGAEVRYKVTSLTEIWMSEIADSDQVTYISGGRLNNNGQIAGTYTTFDGIQHSFIWDSVVGFRDTIDLSICALTRVADINNNGVMVGEIFNSPGDLHAFMWDHENGMRDLGTLGEWIYANDINDNGQVVGASWYDEDTGDDYSHAFLWTEEAGMQAIGVAGESYSTANAINNAGQIIAHTKAHDEIIESIMREPDGTIHYLGSLLEFRAQGINDNGMVVGTGTNTNDTTILRAWTEEEGYRDLGTIDGGNVEGSCINNSSQIAGSVRVFNDDGSSAVHAFLWEEGTGMQYIQDLIPHDSPWNIQSAGTINDNGWILATQYSPDGNHVFLLLTPVPESNASIMVLAVFLAHGLYLLQRYRLSMIVENVSTFYFTLITNMFHMKE